MMQTNKNLLTRDERIDFIIERDGPLCFYEACDKPNREFKSREEITFDHWIPQSAGGTWDITNLRAMHKRCNALKGDRIPNADGTLPPLPRDLRPKAADKSQRTTVCTTCESGRLLLFGEQCGLCGSGPQPAVLPKYLQKQPKDCDHSTFVCWMCWIGHIPRVSAIERIILGP